MLFLLYKPLSLLGLLVVSSRAYISISVKSKNRNEKKLYQKGQEIPNLLVEVSKISHNVRKIVNSLTKLTL